jgi:hypothetical protein
MPANFLEQTKTLHPKPYTRSPKPETLNSKPETLNPKPKEAEGVTTDEDRILDALDP